MHGTGTGTGTGKGSTGTGTGTGKGTGTGTGSGSSIKDAGAGDVAVFPYAAGDSPDACAPPDGSLGCTPGTVSCGGDASCSLATQQCCDLVGTSESCIATGGACSGTVISCNEAADCTNNQICCLNAMSSAVAPISCQDGPTCPAGIGLASAQICRSNAECASGACVVYSCESGMVSIEACKGSVAGALGGSCVAQ
jgi:hypothetical protein